MIKVLNERVSFWNYAAYNDVMKRMDKCRQWRFVKGGHGSLGRGMFVFHDLLSPNFFSSLNNYKQKNNNTQERQTWCCPVAVKVADFI